MRDTVTGHLRAHPRLVGATVAAAALLLQAGNAAAAAMVTYGGP
ncbi:DUF7503 family protein [Halegenticoccus soli]|nr:hypothetical protein [Halegenticoccus soli]